MNKQQET